MTNRPTVGTTHYIACFVEGVNYDGIGGIEITISIGMQKMKISLDDWIQYSKSKEE